jgi:hypothetical protein
LNLTHKGKIKLGLIFWIENPKSEYSELLNSLKVREDKIMNVLFKKNYQNELISSAREIKSSQFIIDSREIYGNHDWLDEIRNFFKRYGIYFDRK